MRYHDHTSQHSGHTFLAFLAGASLALLLGGYYFFGPEGARHRRGADRMIRRMKFEILDKMADIENITEDQYHKIVDEVLNRYEHLRDMGVEKTSLIQKRFRDRWNEMRDAARRAREEARLELEEEEREIENRFP